MKLVKIRRVLPAVVLALTVMVFGLSANVSALVWEAPSPLVNVHGFFDQEQQLLFADMNFLNVPEDLSAVDVYMVLKSVEGDQTFYVNFDLTALISTGSLFDASKITDVETPYFANLNFSELGLSRIDLPGFPIHVGNLPGLAEGNYVIMLALVETGANLAEASPIGNIAVSAVQLPRIDATPVPGPGENECDFNQDGTVDDFEKQKCEKTPEPGENDCDKNGDGTVNPFEELECEKTPEPGENDCDFNQDGMVDDFERKECENAPEPGENDCDENGNGMVDPFESINCGGGEDGEEEPLPSLPDNPFLAH